MRKHINDEDLETIDINGEDEPIVEDKTRKKRKSKKNVLMKEILSNSLYLLCILLCTLLFVKFVAQRTVVIGQSMEPTLYNDNNLIVDKISYRFSEPERFDIIVFPFQYEQETYYIKRIIGLPGETVRIDENGTIYINGEVLEEHYGAEVIEDPGTAYNPITLGPNEYFVLGDNRNHSSDSRTPAVGTVNKNIIIGKAWLRVYPFKQFGFIRHA